MACSAATAWAASFASARTSSSVGAFAAQTARERA